MLVKNWMSKTVITADVDDSMNEVMNLMKEHEIGMVPVMKKGKLVRQWKGAARLLSMKKKALENLTGLLLSSG